MSPLFTKLFPLDSLIAIAIDQGDGHFYRFYSSLYPLYFRRRTILPATSARPTSSANICQ
jgi:hypothetical protein